MSRSSRSGRRPPKSSAKAGAKNAKRAKSVQQSSTHQAEHGIETKYHSRRENNVQYETGSRPVSPPPSRGEKPYASQPTTALEHPRQTAPHGHSTSHPRPKLPSDTLLAQLAYKKQVRQRRMLILRLATIFLAICVSVLLFVGWVLWAPQKNNATGWQVALPRPFQMPPPPDMVLLLMGVDVNPDAKGDPRAAFEGVRSDTMVLARIDTDTENNQPEVTMVSIPRDSKVYLTESGRIGKINGAFAMGGPDQAVRVVERMTGIPVDYYAVVNLSGVKDVVDAIGGVDLTIEAPMQYHDNSGNLHINFEPGPQHLNGQQAMEYLRFRHDSLGDIGRIRRQQVLMNAIAKRLKDPWTLARLPGIVDAVQRNMQTNLPTPLMLQLGWLGKSLQPHTLKVATLPGAPVMESASYWLVDQDSARTVLNRMILKDRLYDNYGYEGDSTDADTQSALLGEFSPVRVGLVYTHAWQAEQIEGLEAILSQGGFSVVCRDRRKRVMTQLVEHREVKQLAARIKATEMSNLQNMQHVVSPIGSTYESNFCSGQEAITLMLGDELQKTFTPTPKTKR